MDFQLPYGEWIRVLRTSGLEVVDLIELRAPERAETTYDLVPHEWARRWPAENIWRARKRAASTAAPAEIQGQLDESGVSEARRLCS